MWLVDYVMTCYIICHTSRTYSRCYSLLWDVQYKPIYFKVYHFMYRENTVTNPLQLFSPKRNIIVSQALAIASDFLSGIYLSIT
jgi:hypothetical protein